MSVVESHGMLRERDRDFLRDHNPYCSAFTRVLSLAGISDAKLASNVPATALVTSPS